MSEIRIMLLRPLGLTAIWAQSFMLSVVKGPGACIGSSEGMTMWRLATAIIAAQVLVVGARAGDTTMMIAGGQCRAAQVGSQPVACATPPKIVYVALPNGIILFNVALADGRVYGFVGDRDSQPKPEAYVLVLKRIRLARGAEDGTRVDVTGTCKMDVSTDGTLVHRLVCDATDGRGGKYLLDFRGNGQPVEVKHFPAS